MKYLALVLLLQAWPSLLEEIPDFIHVCHKSDPDLEKCMIESVEDLRPFLVTGVPEYKIPSLEPLVLHGLLSEDISGLLLNTTNVSAFGCSNYIVKSIKMDLDEVTCDLDVDIPELRILAHYDVDGKVLMLPVKGKGNLEANVTNVQSKTVMKGETYEKDGQKYMRYTSADLNVKVGDGKVVLENLFNGDKVLLQIMNDVVNKNLDMFLRELMPPIQDALAEVFLNSGNDILEHFSIDQLFPN